MNVVVHPADVQDRDGAFHLLRRARRLFPFIERIFADGGYAGRKMALTVWRTGAWKLQIVKRSDAAGFEVLPKRWIVERTFAWISRNRRLARDFERYATTVVAFICLAMIRIMLRRTRCKHLAMNLNFPDGLLVAKISSSSLSWRASVSRFWVFWIRKTIRNVMIVVPVLITSCHVSL